MVKTDQEPAIKTWARDLGDAREEGRTIFEESPARSSGSSGRAERAVQSLEGQIRALLLSLESHLGFEIDAGEPIITYLPEYAAYLLNRLEIGKDGKTAYERCNGSGPPFWACTSARRSCTRPAPWTSSASSSRAGITACSLASARRAMKSGSRPPRRRWPSEPFDAYP